MHARIKVIFQWWCWRRNFGGVYRWGAGVLNNAGNERGHFHLLLCVGALLYGLTPCSLLIPIPCFRNRGWTKGSA